MAESVVEIVIRARNELRDTLAEIKKQLDGLSGALQQGVELEDTALGLKQVGEEAKATTKAAQGTQQELNTIGQSAQGLVFGLRAVVAGFLALKAVRMGKEFADIAGRAETLGTVLKIVGANAGITLATINKMEEGIRAMGITASSARYSLTQMIQAGLVNAESADKAAKLARAAQDLAVVTGRNSSETFQRLVVNIQQMDSVGLRWMGLMIDRNKGERDYANLLGKSREQLTLIERRQAFFNAVMTESVKLQGSYEASMTNVAKQIQSLARFEEEAARSLGQFLLPAQLAVVKEWSSFLDQVAKTADGMDGVSEAAFQFGKAVEALAKSVRFVLDLMIEWKGVLSALAGVFTVKYVVSGLEMVTRSLLGIRGEVKTTTAAMGLFKLTAESTRTVLTTPIAVWPGLKLFFAEASTGFAAVRRSAMNAWEAMSGLTPWLRLRATAAVTLSSIVAMFKTQFNGVSLWSGLLTGLRATVTAARGIIMGLSAALSWALPIMFAVQAFMEYMSARKAEQETQASQRVEYMEKANEILSKEEEQRTRVLQLERRKIELDALVARGNATARDELSKVNAEIEEQNKALKTTTKEWEKLLGSATSAEQQNEAINLRTEFVIDRARPANQLKLLQEELDTAKRELGLDKLSIEPNLVLTNEFISKIGHLQTLLSRLRDPVSIEVNGTMETISVEVQEVTESIRELVRTTSRPEELLRLFSVIDQAIRSTGQSYESFRNQLQAKYEKTVIEQVAEATAFLSERLTEASEVFKVISDAQFGAAERSRKMEEVFLSIGASADQARAGIYDLYLPLNTFKDLTTQIANINLRSFTEQYRMVRETAQAETVKIQQIYEAGISSLDEKFGTREATFERAITRLKKIQLEVEGAALQPSDEGIRTMQEMLDTRYRTIDLQLRKEEFRLEEAKRVFEANSTWDFNFDGIEEYLQSIEQASYLSEGLSDDIGKVRTVLTALEAVSKATGDTSSAQNALLNVLQLNYSKVLTVVRQRVQGITSGLDREREAWQNHVNETRILDEQRTKNLLAQAQKNLTGLRGIYDKIFEAWKTTLGRMQEIDKQINSIILDRDRTEREIEREGMSAMEADYDRRRELLEIEDQIRTATFRKEYAQIEELTNRRKALVQEISSSGLYEAEELRLFKQREMNEAANDQLQALRMQKLELVATAREQENVLSQVDQDIQNVEKTVEALGGERIVQLKVQMDPESITRALGQFQELFVKNAEGLLSRMAIGIDSTTLQAAVSQVKNAFDGIEVTIKAKIEEAMAGGGLVPTIRRAMGGLVSLPLTTLRTVRDLSTRALGLPAFAAGGSVGQAPTHGGVLREVFREHVLRSLTAFALGGAAMASGASAGDLHTSAIPRYAIGTSGAVSGPGTGTSDDILAWLSNGEFVIKAKAVDFYGQDLLRALNEMRLPKAALPAFAEGGYLRVDPPKLSSGGSVSSLGPAPEPRRDIVDVNLNVAGRKVSLMGEREQVRELVSALKGLEVAR